MSDRLPPALAGAVDLSSLAAKHQNAATGPGGQPSQADSGATGVVVTVGDAEFAQVVEVSSTVPVIVLFRSDRSPDSATLATELERLVASFRGKMVLAHVNADSSPQLVQAFQAQSIPTVAAVIAGRPAPLFAGRPAVEEIQQVLDQVLEFAASQGVSGSVPFTEDQSTNDDQSEAEEPPLPPLHQEAFDALSAGNFEAAIAAYEKAIVQNPRDAEAVAGLAQVRMLDRLSTGTADEIRAAAASQPDDVEAQMAVADLDVSGGHVDDAFSRMLDLVAKTSGEERQSVRLRLIDLFEVVGIDDPRVAAARRRLTALLY